MKQAVAFLTVLLIPFIILAQSTNSVINNSLSKNEIKQGWQLLFDGQTLNGWKGYNSDQVFDSWSVANGELICKAKDGSETNEDIITVSDFENFDLSLEWNISNVGNSGIFYHVLEGKQYKSAYETGPEYQLIDDAGWPEKLESWQKTGSDYAMYPAVKDKNLMPVGEWNSSRIIYNKGHVEYWLNGMKVVEFQAYSPEWEQKKSTGKWKDYPDYAISKTGHIGLQNHGNGVRFRNIKVRKIE